MADHDRVGADPHLRQDESIPGQDRVDRHGVRILGRRANSLVSARSESRAPSRRCWPCPRETMPSETAPVGGAWRIKAPANHPDRAVSSHGHDAATPRLYRVPNFVRGERGSLPLGKLHVAGTARSLRTPPRTRRGTVSGGNRDAPGFLEDQQIDPVHGSSVAPVRELFPGAGEGALARSARSRAGFPRPARRRSPGCVESRVLPRIARGTPETHRTRGRRPGCSRAAARPRGSRPRSAACARWEWLPDRCPPRARAHAQRRVPAPRTEVLRTECLSHGLLDVLVDVLPPHVDHGVALGAEH
jgi:hypothetical protein